MAEPEKRVKVVDDPTAKRQIIAGTTFSSPQSLIAAMEWLLAAPQLGISYPQPSKHRVSLSIGTVETRGVAELVYYSRDTTPDVRDGSSPDFAFVLVISDSGTLA